MNIEDAIEEALRDAAGDLIEQNKAGLAGKIVFAEDGTITLGMTLKLVKLQDKLCCEGKANYTEKFPSDTCSTADLDDPSQPKLRLDDGEGEAVGYRIKKGGAK